MGILYCTDDEIRGQSGYRNAVKSLNFLDVSLTEFKVKGCDPDFLCISLWRAFEDIVEAEKLHPDFKEWKVLRNKPLEILTSLRREYPDHKEVKKLERYL